MGSNHSSQRVRFQIDSPASLAVAAAAVFILAYPFRRRLYSRFACSDAKHPSQSLLSLAATQRTLGSVHGSIHDADIHAKTAYDTGPAVAEYLHFHYGKLASPMHGGLPVEAMGLLTDAPRRVGQYCAELLQSLPASQRRILDVGCAVGGMTFELSKLAQQVIGIDSSDAFIATARQLKEKGSFPYSFSTEGDSTIQHLACIPNDVERARCEFSCCDAVEFCKGSTAHDTDRFHLVLACNVLCRMQSPREWLESLPGILAADGALVVLITPYAWLEAWTPKYSWLGGQQGLAASDVVSKIMQQLGFSEVRRFEVPFLLAQNDRICELFMSELTAWRWH